MKKNQVLVLGGVSFNTMIYLDAFPAPQPQTVFARGCHETVGSTGAGKALNLHRLGFGVTLHGVIGDDAYGRILTHTFTDENLVFLSDIDPAGTKWHVNLMNDAGQRISIFVNSGSPEPEVNWARLEPMMADCDVVALGIVNYCRQAIPLLRHYGKEIWCDIHDYDGANPYHQAFIEAATHIHMSSDAMPDYRPFMQQMIAAGKQMVLCTHGQAGATAVTAAGEWVEMPILPHYARVDTNGAGDAFWAGFLYGRMQQQNLTACMRLGTIVAGLCVTSHELAYEALSPERVQAEYARWYG
jgi:sugar/nucleoside kinase (ribokinase family)